MSKAFTKEDDGVPAAPARKRGVPVPQPNFVTASGLAAAREELETLLRASGAGATGDPDRIRELTEVLDSRSGRSPAHPWATAQVAPPGEPGVVGLGATVTVEDEDGNRSTYKIVGNIEADARRGHVSWQSPVASALWGARVGDTVDLPRGEVEIVAIDS